MQIVYAGDNWTQGLQAQADMILREFVTEFCWRCPPVWENFTVSVHSRQGQTIVAFYSRVRDEVTARMLP